VALPRMRREYRHALDETLGEDSKGQDLKVNYVMCMRFELAASVQTMCAMAEAPMTT
jgi:hypothetical protein